MIHTILLVTLLSCTSGKTVTIAFTDIGTLDRGAKLILDSLPIGYVDEFYANKMVDTIFVKVRLNKKIKIPVGSDIYLQESILGSSVLKVVYSTNHAFISEHDIIIGKYSPSSYTPKILLDSAHRKHIQSFIKSLDSMGRN